jgi:hypothetical protein
MSSLVNTLVRNTLLTECHLYNYRLYVSIDALQCSQYLLPYTVHHRAACSWQPCAGFSTFINYPSNALCYVLTVLN